MSIYNSIDKDIFDNTCIYKIMYIYPQFLFPFKVVSLVPNGVAS